MNNGWDQFAKYVGVQGIMAILLVGGYIYASLTGITVTDFYGQLMTLIIGFYFAKNGIGILETLAKVLRPVDPNTTKKGH